MTETPRANRIHIAFFGLRNAGKSTLVNAFTGQRLAIVSDTPGTTTDPVSKAMEILPLGPCLVTDTAGLDDEGELGAQRVAKTLEVLATTDVAVWVWGGGEKVGGESRWTADGRFYKEFRGECQARHVTVLEYRRGESVEALKEKIAALKLGDDTPGLLDGLVQAGDRVICVCPIDGAAPKGRLILPQVQVIRAALDLHATCEVCQPEELASILRISDFRFQISEADAEGQISEAGGRTLVITDSQAFGAVREILIASRLMSHVSRPTPHDKGRRLETRDASAGRETRDAGRETRDAGAGRETRDAGAGRETRDAGAGRETRDAGAGLLPCGIRLTSFSILFARQKGDLDEYVKGLAALRALKDGDTVLIAEGCTHHRQCNDIGTVKIPKALQKLSGKNLNFVFASGGDFSLERAGDLRLETGDLRLETGDLRLETGDLRLETGDCKNTISLIVHCGGCMLTRREVLRRISLARDAGIPIVNYGMLLAAANGIEISPGSCFVDIVAETPRLGDPVRDCLQ